MFKLSGASVTTAVIALALLGAQTANSGQIKAQHLDASGQLDAALSSAGRVPHGTLSEADRRAMKQAAEVARRDHDPDLNGSIQDALLGGSVPDESLLRSQLARPRSTSLSAN